MQSDAKFGLIVGVVLVLAVAVLFFPNEPAATRSPAPAQTAENNAPASAAALLPALTPIAKPKGRQTPGQTTSRVQDEERTSRAEE